MGERRFDGCRRAGAGRRGFIIWGSKTRLKETNTPRLRATCPKCQVQSDFVEKQVVTYFHLYWIPLFPIGRGLKFIECQYCHGQFELSLDELRAREEAEAQQQHAEAAAAAAHQQRQEAEADTLRQAWIAQPEDRATLIRLLDLLAGQNRYADVQSLEGEIRQRYGNDPDLLIRLAHAAFALQRYDDAIRDYEALVVANPYRGDARFYLASSYWSRQPPDWAKAVEHMQVAAQMGYPAAVDALPKLKRAQANS